MKKIFTFLITILLTITSTASVKQVKKAAEATCSITSYDKDNKIMKTGCGIFVDSSVGIASMSLFKGAHKVVVKDTEGRSFDVIRICGADELYDVIKFKVSAPTSFAEPAKGKADGDMWTVEYTSATPTPQKANIDKVESFMEKYSYYILSSENTKDFCALITDDGKVAGLIQKSSNGGIHATDAAYAANLTTYGLALNNPAVKCCDIPLMLPDKKEEALLMMILSGNTGDKVQHEASVHDFLENYPKMPDGYMARAGISTEKKDYEAADRDLKESVRLAEKKSEFYFNYAKTIFRVVSSDKGLKYKEWTADKAYELAEKACAEDDQPVYRQLMAQILFSKANYGKAYDTYINIVSNGKVYPDAYYGAAQCKIMEDAPKEEIIALLDSAVNSCDSVNYHISAPYVFLRASIYIEMGEFRKAVTDYYRYEILCDGKMNAQFYYIREQTELKAKMYQQALSDIHKAIMLAPEEPSYYAEAGALELKVKMYEEAEVMGRKCIEIAPEYADGYLILGLALKYQGKTEESEKALQQAKALGSNQTDIDTD